MDNRVAHIEQDEDDNNDQEEMKQDDGNEQMNDQDGDQDGEVRVYEDKDENDDEDDDEEDEEDDHETPLEKLKKKNLKKKSIHGINAKNLIEKITRMKIQSHPYWKEKCIGLNEETLIDRAMVLESFGGCFGGNKKPTHFLCLLYKMLQIQPEMAIIRELIMNDDFKYVRILGAFYLRLTGKPVEIYSLLEPLYADYRALRKKGDLGNIKVHVDEFIEELLTTNYSCDIALPHIPTRYQLVQQGLLNERESPVVELGLIKLKDIEEEEYNKILNERNPSTKQIENKEHKVKDKYRDKSPTRKDRDNRDDNKKRNRSLSPNNKNSDDSDHNDGGRSTNKKKKDISKYEKQSNTDFNETHQPKQSKTEQDEIDEMNAIRAKLGLKPLKQ